MTERQMIQEILNTVDVLYKFEDTDDDKKEYNLLIYTQDNDKRPIEEVNQEIKEYFQDADFTYDETINPDEDTDIKVKVKR